MGVRFCSACGNLLEDSPNEILECEQCGKSEQNKALHQTETRTSENFPSKLRNRLKSHTQTPQKAPSGPTMDIECPKCPSKEVYYAQVQLRSADEGSTIFYTCVGCAHRWQENN
ncbi:DNA-directed RNA polymerase I subunit RPA12 [Aspergillus melleus]|uniref:DNA-directed RNA polymerase I subunit RPA12 n=1 Tax=Aspergillus melleus TaxID=138277 RepID=UPI001E8E2F0D|nr:DNA-directed RNA polymerase I subunit RPA12 [Aspergillus melleus]KAH8433229.1 DNA-directed RNA polymerase I subunit RPA12 [Aspergillus melleus]